MFRESLARLAAVTYQNDGFYDPVRGEHCDVSFGFLSYRLPLPDHDAPGHSSRVWRISWDPVFFEFCTAVRGSLTFDLPLYRSLDPASRRLFLLLQKVFWRRRISPWFDVRHLAVDVLGFSHTLLQEWADITLAAIERRRRFHRSPQAFFIDSIRHARDAGRTPPDWWHEVRREENRREDEDVWRSLRSRLGPDDRKTSDDSVKSRPTRIGDLLS